jgi:hypothetical protein
VLPEAEAALRSLSPRLADRANERGPFRDEGEGERRVRDRVAPFVDRADELEDAVADREDGARDEDQHGGEKGPEEPLLPVPEWMLVVRVLLAEGQRGQEKGLVRRVGHRVGGLRQHCRRARQRARHALRDGDRGVRSQGNEHGLALSAHESELTGGHRT